MLAYIVLYLLTYLKKMYTAFSSLIFTTYIARPIILIFSSFHKSSFHKETGQ